MLSGKLKSPQLSVELDNTVQLIHLLCSTSISPEVWLKHLASPPSPPLWIWACTSHQEVQGITCLSLVSQKLFNLASASRELQLIAKVFTTLTFHIIFCAKGNKIMQSFCLRLREYFLLH